MACGCAFGAATNREAVVVEPGILAGASDFDGSRYALSASTATVSTVPTAAKYFKISMGRPPLSPPIPNVQTLLRIQTTNKAQSSGIRGWRRPVRKFDMTNGPVMTREDAEFASDDKVALANKAVGVIRHDGHRPQYSIVFWPKISSNMRRLA